MHNVNKVKRRRKKKRTRVSDSAEKLKTKEKKPRERKKKIRRSKDGEPKSNCFSVPVIKELASKPAKI